MRKNDVIYALMNALVKCNQGNGGASAPEESAPVEKYSPSGKQSSRPAPGFDWLEEEKVAYEPVDDAADMWGEKDQEDLMDQDYGWVGEEERDAAEKRPCYRPKDKEKDKEKKCHCQPWPWEEKWICTKQSRICCEPIKCQKKKDPCHDDGDMWGKEDSRQEDQDYGWVGEEERDYAEKRPCYRPEEKEKEKEKEKKCYCQPWEEKWICTKQSRVCCEPIKCEKKKDPCHKDPCHKDPCHWDGGLR